ncbi:hypothetical protein GCM10009775_29050 [Microbacterium aoyamense]|uniref:Uncharacterized protein n=1 Tax=Microbacterium aoyamense TaxID=344166 RepID=A0ABN2PWX0_9MICO
MSSDTYPVPPRARLAVDFDTPALRATSAIPLIGESAFPRHDRNKHGTKRDVWERFHESINVNPTFKCPLIWDRAIFRGGGKLAWLCEPAHIPYRVWERFPMESPVTRGGEHTWACHSSNDGS